MLSVGTTVSKLSCWIIAAESEGIFRRRCNAEQANFVVRFIRLRVRIGRNGEFGVPVGEFLDDVELARGP